MNIAFVARESFPQDLAGQIGGIGRYAQSMSAALAARGADVTVISQSPDSGFSITERDNMRIVRLPKWESGSSSLAWRYGRMEAWFLRTGLGREAWADVSGKLRRALLVDRYLPLVQQKLGCAFDVVEFPECGAEGLFYLCRTQRQPCVVRIHCPTQLLVRNNADRAALGKRLLVRLERFAAKRADVVTSPSRSAATLARGEWKLTGTNPVVIPNLFDSGMFFPDKAERGNGPFTIAYSGRLERIKGLMHFPDVLSCLAARGVDFRVRLMGRDTDTAPGSASMRRWLQDSLDPGLKDRVAFLGHRNERDMVSELNRADVGLYLSAYETFGYAALEAQACGLPVIASRDCGIGEVVVHGETGFLVDPSDHETIVDHLCRLRGDPELRDRMGLAAASHARSDYSIQNGCSRFLDFYADFAAAARRNA